MGSPLVAGDAASSLKPVEVAIVDWLARAPLRRAAYNMHGVGTASGTWSFLQSVEDRGVYGFLRGDDEVEVRKHLFGRSGAPMGRLVRMGFVVTPKAEVLATRLGGRGSYRSTTYTLGQAGLVWWREEGAARYEALARVAAGKRAASERMVIVGSWVRTRPDLPQGFTAPATSILVATHAAVVTRETAGRVYVEQVGSVYDPPGDVDHPFAGRVPNLYADKAQVMFDHVDEAFVRRVAEHEAGHLAEVLAIQSAYAAEVADAIRRLRERTVQKAAERADTLASLRGDASAHGPRRS